MRIDVAVITITDIQGKIMPLSILWEDGREFAIDKVLSVCRAASLKAGGCGNRYTCRIRNRVIYLFNEEGKWFMEGIE